MPTILYIETATEVCSVALSKGNEVVASISSDRGNSHTEHLFPFIEKVINESRNKISDLDALVLSIGPGSYTGLRIGASAAKGICYALNIPLIGISTLQSIALGAIKTQKKEQNALFCPMIDARRLEVFTALFNNKGEMVSKVENIIIDKDSFAAELEKSKIYFCGNGAEKCQNIITHRNACFINSPLVAENMLIPALKKYKEKQFENVAYFEPFYLKEYVAKKSAVKGMR